MEFGLGAYRTTPSTTARGEPAWVAPNGWRRFWARAGARRKPAYPGFHLVAATDYLEILTLSRLRQMADGPPCIPVENR